MEGAQFMGDNVPFRLGAKSVEVESASAADSDNLNDDGSDLALWKRVFRHAYSLVGNKAEAEDLAQDTFVELFRSRAAGKSVEWISAWTRTVTKRLVNRRYRELRPDLHIPLETIMQDGKRISWEPSDGQPSQEKLLINRTMIHLATKTLSELSERERECVLMYFRGYDFPQIASALGVSRWTARRLTLDVIKKVRARLQPEKIDENQTSDRRSDSGTSR
jgi:RNA polymerase sigma factor (sigma-70 family)